MMIIYSLTMVNIYLAEVLMGSTDDEAKMNMNLRGRYEYFMRTHLFYIMFAVPNFRFYAGYVLIHIFFIALLSVHRGNLANEAFIETLSQQPVYIILSMILFHICTIRQLKSFFKQQ